MPKKKLPDEITREVIRLFAERTSWEYFNIVFAQAAMRTGLKKEYRSDGREGRYNEALRRTQKEFFNLTGAKEDNRKEWPQKARAYLGIPEVPPKPRATRTTTMLRPQKKLPF